MRYHAVLQRYDDGVCDIAVSDDRGECWSAALAFYTSVVVPKLLPPARSDHNKTIAQLRDVEMIVVMYETTNDDGIRHPYPVLLAQIGADLEDGPLVAS